MNRLVKMGLWLLALSMICFPAIAEKIPETEVVKAYGVETTYFHGPIPIRLASPGENDISMEEALRIAHQVAMEDGTLMEFELEGGPRNVHYVILSDVNESYHIGGWVITYFTFGYGDGDSQTVIIEGASGDVLFAVGYNNKNKVFTR